MKRRGSKLGWPIFKHFFLFVLMVSQTAGENVTSDDTGISYGYEDYPFNTTTTAKEFEKINILDLISRINNSILAIQSNLTGQLENLEPRLVNVTKKSHKDVILFTFSALQELIDQTMAEMEALRGKISMAGVERINTAVSTCLMKTDGQKGNLTFDNGWMELEDREISESVLNLRVNYKKLTKFYEMHSMFLPTFKTRLEVAAFHDPNQECKPPICPNLNSWFPCDSGDQLIPCNKYCNGYFDCNDKSDEPLMCEHPFLPTCDRNVFRCDDGRECAHYKYCRKRDLCSDGSHTAYCEANRNYWSFD